MLLGIVAFIYLMVGLLIQKGEKIQTQTVNLPTTTPFKTKLTPTPTFEPKLIIQFPVNDTWLEYKSTCLGLREDVTVYYPQSWKTGKDGETSITDGPGTSPLAKASECEISFGYPIAPLGHQDPYLPGLEGYIIVGSVLSDGQTIDDLLAKFNDYKVKTKYLTEVGGRKWVKIIWEDSDSIYLMTIYKNRIYQVYYNASIGNQRIDPSSSGYLVSVYEEFISRLAFH